MDESTYASRLGIELPTVARVANEPGFKLYELMIAALFEHGGPMSLEQLVERLAQETLGEREDLATSLVRSWRGRLPLYRRRDGTFDLNLQCRELRSFLFRFRDHAATAPEPSPPIPEVRFDEPLTRDEYEDLVQAIREDSPGAGTMSTRRVAAAWIDSQKLRSSSNEALKSMIQEKLGQQAQLHSFGSASGLTMDSEGAVFDPSSGEAVDMRAAVRAAVVRFRTDRANREKSTERLRALQEADRARKARAREEARQRSKCLVCVVPSFAKPEAIGLLDFNLGLSRVFEAGELDQAREAIRRYDAVVAQDVLVLFEVLGIESNNTLMVDLRPAQKSVKVDGKVHQATIARALSEMIDYKVVPEAKWRDMKGTQFRSALRRELDALASLYVMGVATGHMVVNDRKGITVPVDWCLPGELNAYSICREGQQSGREVELWFTPIVRLSNTFEAGIRGKVLECGWEITIDRGYGAETINRDEIYFARELGSEPQELPEPLFSRILRTTELDRLHSILISDLIALARETTWVNVVLPTWMESINARTLGDLFSPDGARWIAKYGSKPIWDDLADFMEAAISTVPQVPTLPKDREALIQWARHNLPDDFELTIEDNVSVVEPFLSEGDRESVRRMRGVFLEAVLFEPEVCLGSVDPFKRERIRHAAWMYLLEAADSWKRALAEEQSIFELAIPENERLADLHQRLLVARRAAREAGALPRALDGIGPAAVVVERRSGRLIFTESQQTRPFRHMPKPLRAAGGSRAKGEVVFREVDTLGPGELGDVSATVDLNDLEVRCSCDEDATCEHVLTFVDLVARKLVEKSPEAGSFTWTILSIMCRPRVHALSVIDAWAELDEADLRWFAEPDDLGRFRVKMLGPEVYVHKWATSVLFWSHRAAIAAAASIPMEDREHRIEKGWVSGMAAHRALRALPEGTRVKVGREWARLRDAPLQLVVVPQESGDVDLVPSILGRALSSDELAQGRQSTAGGIWIHFDGQELRSSPLSSLESRSLLTTEVPDGGLDVCDALIRSGKVPGESLDLLEPRLAKLAALGFEVRVRGQVPGSEIPTLVIRFEPASNLGFPILVQVVCRPISGSGVHVVPGRGGTTLVARAQGQWRSVRRDLQRESRAFAELGIALASVIETADWKGPEPLLDGFEISSHDRLLGLVEVVEKSAASLGTRLIMEWPQDRAWWISRVAGPANFRGSVQSRGDWLGLDGEVVVDEATVALSSVLAAIRHGRRYVVVSPGRVLRFGLELEAGLRDLLDLGVVEENELLFPPELLVSLLHEAQNGAMISGEDGVDLRAYLEESKVPEGLRTQLRPYQLVGFRWLSQLSRIGAGALLADDMGLGKTVQTLALLVERADRGPALVVSPSSVISVWAEQIQGFAPSLRLRRFERDRELADLRAGDVVVSSYELLTREVEKLERLRFGTFVMDEAQAVRNASTSRARAAARMRSAFRVALTGTPLQNSVEDLWSLFSILCPALAKAFSRFQESCRLPREAILRSPLFRLFLLRRTKEQVAPELPPKTEMTLNVPLQPAHRALYDAERLRIVTELSKDDLGPVDLLARISRLRQLAIHPRLIDDRSTIPSAKLQALTAMIQEAVSGGHRVLVFTQFVQMLHLISSELREMGIPFTTLQGATPTDERELRIASFMSGAVPVFLISLLAGGTGLTLTRADYVFHVDPWWNPAVEDQATDRAHRIGQDRPVMAVRLVSEGTIEEEVLKLHAVKRQMASEALAGSDENAGLSAEEMLRLIRAALDATH